MDSKFKVSCFGAGFVGLPTSSVLALKNPDTDVTQFKFSLSFTILTKEESSLSIKEKCPSSSPDSNKLWPTLSTKTLF